MPKPGGSIDAARMCSAASRANGPENTDRRLRSSCSGVSSAFHSRVSRCARLSSIACLPASGSGHTAAAASIASGSPSAIRNSSAPGWAARLGEAPARSPNSARAASGASGSTASTRSPEAPNRLPEVVTMLSGGCAVRQFVSSEASATVAGSQSSSTHSVTPESFRTPISASASRPGWPNDRPNT